MSPSKTARCIPISASGVGWPIIIPVIVAAGLGGVVGYSISYWVGHYFKDSIGSIWPFSRHPNLIPKGEEFFDEHGLWSVFLGHFIGPVRAVIPVIAGLSRMYRGMHYPTDAAGGIALGLTTLAVMTYAVNRTIDRTRLGRGHT